jgi:undecaprenyl-diphosphatase
LWEIFVAIILGIVEGLTEFIPVSSTGHMIIVDDILFKSDQLFSKEVANTFKVVIQLGSIMAVVIVFKDRFIDLLDIRKEISAKTKQRLGLLKIGAGLLPAAILGLLFEDYIDEYLFSIHTVLIGLVVGAILMIIADRVSPRIPRIETVDQITYKEAIGIGLFQCMALWPGFSRSGSTISGGVIFGLSHRAASDFTFIMAVPIMLGASGLSLIKHWDYFSMDVLPFFVAGFISAFIFAWFSINYFLKLINRVKLVPFAIYRIVLAAVIAIFIYL